MLFAMTNKFQFWIVAVIPTLVILIGIVLDQIGMSKIRMLLNTIETGLRQEKRKWGF